MRSLFFLLGLMLAAPAIAEEDPEDRDLSGLLRVELKNGRSHSGWPVAFKDDLLFLRIRMGGGEVEQGFPREDIARLHFPGSEVEREAAALVQEGHLTEAVEPLELLWRQRAPFLGLLDEESLDLLSALPAAHLAAGDPYRAISLANRLLPRAPSPATHNHLQEAILLGHLDLEFWEEASDLAREWIHGQEDFPDSALGWKILAELALLEEDLDRVLWVALQPIAISGPAPAEHLDSCYALAIHAFHLKEEPVPAVRLYREMTEDLRLMWPGDAKLAETGEIYRLVAEQETAAAEAATEADLDLRPPEDDLNLPIQKIRKLLRKESP